MLDKNELMMIGIDGGGTHTRGAIYKGNNLIAQMKSGTTRIGAVGVGESSERTLNVIMELCKKAEVEASEIDAVVVGVAGVWLEEEKKRSQNLIRTLARGQKVVLNDLMVTSDAEIALQGALGDDNGVIIIVGTGSISLGKFGNDIIRCGGWGIELDDEGSGAWIGREGLTAVVRAIDGRGETTVLIDKLSELYPTINLEEPRTIVKAYAERAFEYQMLTPYIMQAAENNDAVCLEIIQRAAKRLVELPKAIKKKTAKKSINIALLGGIIEANTLLKNILEDEIKKIEGLELIEPKGTPIDGAIYLAGKMIEQEIQ
ncbi:MAG TPA: BadF/BadG/BcrA/BcrD ATPase family protein [Candidatus Kapabacteria bacterium]|nr:BadF/BadG/BcrA/BcrD ATPase family protein [Candidatus Kapabacteria bacterium]